MATKQLMPQFGGQDITDFMLHNKIFMIRKVVVLPQHNICIYLILLLSHQIQKQLIDYIL
ncbi:hypothetical protein CBP51_13955 [Cellvibrio mixtus]|uniref:Uncharacterized protein n=1 Tax=Cellvibrio mixtus TaxID=39650 RepID=A0A266Q366_9GAMM|nr:hypothetical protein B0D95_01060 [Cellvibrio sp. PSBB023]OZY84314.1 hypothetical protein CBP51_13955 [Cellvibrio mixtus]